MIGTAQVTRGQVGQLSLFEGVELDAIEGLVTTMPVMELGEGEILFRPGEHNDSLYLLLEGHLEIHLESPDGPPITVLGPGDSVGELSVIDSLETSAYVTAQSPCRLAVMDQMTLWTLINESDGFARNMLYLVSRRVRSDNERTIASRQRRRQWEHYSTVDALSGLHNRRWMDETFGRLLERARRNADPLSLIRLDVDDFKQYNDNEGHVAGDYALMAVAKVLRSQLRPTDHAIRYSDGEFCVLLPQTNRAAAAGVAERLRDAIAKAIVRTEDGEDLPRVTASLGVTELHADDSVAATLERASRALAQAKQGGSGSVAVVA